MDGGLFRISRLDEAPAHEGPDELAREPAYEREFPLDENDPLGIDTQPDLDDDDDDYDDDEYEEERRARRSGRPSRRAGRRHRPARRPRRRSRPSDRSRRPRR